MTPSLTRRHLLSAGLLSAAALPGTAQTVDVSVSREDLFQAAWPAWKSTFVQADGRVVDTLQGSSSHSEGQGYGLILAAQAGDAEAFGRIRDWSFRTLMVRETDRLLAWRWQQGVGITDHNNATDGDLLFAWGLCLGATAFGQAQMLDLADLIIRDVISHATAPDPRDAQKLILKPAVEGFDRQDGWLINPSYYVFPALYGLAEHSGRATLAQLANDGLQLVADLSRNSLPPDWCRLTANGFARDPDKRADFGYEAMRIPLYLAMAGMPGHPTVRYVTGLWDRALRSYAQTGQFPTVLSNAATAQTEFSNDPGYAGMAASILNALDPTVAPQVPSDTQAYYPATLHMLAASGAGVPLKGCA